ncbi:glycoside hydrolase family 63 protein [Amanita thiersii Skay4041]|uniref:Mannosyl-oligosaccharide glucosidase n=1 Tax=Amanita thiersii Skay4041 TaxID=703135 RepID=A0A2A9NVQ5_9AGAR|nr:glycoside hydrolase family 63 protein [Amanita thiersii Skay4041]
MTIHLTFFWLLSLAHISLATHVNDTLLWGPYRPNLYFGLRPRIPQSLMTGLIWFGTQDFQSVTRARHACEQGDNLAGYTWTKFDPRQGGIQVLNDSLNNVKMTTEFLKVPGGDHGGSWAARIKGEPLTDDKPSHISTIFYVGLEGLGGLDMETEENEDGIEGEFRLSGTTPELDDFTIRVTDTGPNKPVEDGVFASNFQNNIGKTHFLGRPVTSGSVWKAKDVILTALIERARFLVTPYVDPATGNPAGSGTPDPSYVLQLPDDVFMNSNLFAIQKTFDGPFQFDVYYDSASNTRRLSPSIIDSGMRDFEASFDEQFMRTFPYPSNIPQEKWENIDAFSKAVTSNLMAGVGYFYGNSIVDTKFSQEWDEEDDGPSADNGAEENTGPRLSEPKALLTATPSRSFFPRGFYWDEGFHLLHIGQWDNDFSLEILRDWINLIDEDGWVAREQILGEEARSKVPKEFQTQVPNYANPPTLTMAVTAFTNRLKAASARHGPTDADLGLDYGMNAGPQTHFTTESPSDPGNEFLQNPELAMSFLKSIYIPLKRHYEWFRRTQRGQIKQYGRKARSKTEAYRWRGRSELHVLTSGMDDYPRGPPHAGELHLDLISWMAFFTRTMRDIAEFIGEVDDVVSYKDIEKAILNNIEDLHWNEDMQMYCDVGVNEDDESYHVCHKGYLSIFPFLLSLLPPDSPHLGFILDLVRDPHHLWSPYGIRSLSASHPEFGQGENYWKGPIWVQMNYLVLSALHNTYAAHDGPHQAKAKEIYTELRNNIINNVVKEYEQTGYVWEQYDAISGKGLRSHPFTGWTSLTAMIIAEKY